MGSNSGSLRFFVVVLLLCVGIALTGSSQTVNKPEGTSASTADQGKQILASNCASCHGIDGKGSERAPNITDSPYMRQLSDAQLKDIISNGIPGTGMPAFHSLSDSLISDLIAYLRSGGGAGDAAKLPGTPKNGKAIFFAQAGCSKCHMIAGQGGFIASDLTEYARTHSVDQVREAILGSSSAEKRTKLATAVLRNGKKYVGRVRNEDNFSVQLQSLDGTFHFIARSELKKIDYDPQPMMPASIGSSLTASELNDLISYLLSASGNANPQARAKDHEMDDLEE
ncbi:MAG TPA: c-type cytochrome [Candidatus Sulfotelmatobacter sp.]|nr:c-type cytochrome [Candidatus Sulfotelmatobacter sp.]